MIGIFLSYILAYISYISSEKKDILSFQQQSDSNFGKHLYPFRGLFVWNSASRLACLGMENFDQYLVDQQFMLCGSLRKL